MHARDAVIAKLFHNKDVTVHDVKFFPGPNAVDAADSIWVEFHKALDQFDSGKAKAVKVWQGKTKQRNLEAFIASR